MSGNEKELLKLFKKIEKLKLDESNYFILKGIKTLILKNQELEINASIIKEKLEDYIKAISLFNDDCSMFNNELADILKDKEGASN